MKRIFFLLTVSAAMAAVSCKKNFLDINDNPNSATASTPQLNIPAALEASARIQETSYLNGLAYWVGYWATSSGFAKPVETYTYNISSNFNSGTWDALYDNISDWTYIENAAISQKLPVYQAISKVMKAYDYEQLVDLWGNVPYSEAAKGASVLAPKYDDQKAIYTDLVKQIDSALLIFNKPGTEGTISVATDKVKILLYGSTIGTVDPATFIAQWVRFANTLKLKLLINQSQTGQDTFIKGELAGLTAADFMQLGEDAVLNPGYLASVGKLSPFFGAFYSSTTKALDNYNSIRASDYAAKAYTAVNDPRVSYFYDKKTAAAYTGSVFGDPTGTSNAAAVGLGLLQPIGDAIVFTAAEGFFLQAEAVQRGYMTGNAKALWTNGILSSFTFTKVASPATAVTTYTAQANPDANWDLATDKIKVIITQKWFALNGIDILSAYKRLQENRFSQCAIEYRPNQQG